MVKNSGLAGTTVEISKQKKKVSIFVGSEILYHLAQDVKKLFSGCAKLALSSYLSSNVCVTRSAAIDESTRKSNHILACIKHI